MHIMHILPHSLEPFVPNLKTPQDWKTLEHHATRFIEHLKAADPSIEHELWTLSRTANKPFLVHHQSGFIVRVFPTDITIFLPLETSMSLIKTAWQESKNNTTTVWHLHAYYLWLYDWLAVILAWHGQKFVAHFRGGAFTIRALPYSLYHYVLALPFTLRLADKIFVQNKREMHRLQRWYLLSAQRLLFIPNCSEVTLSPKKKPNSVIKLIYVGRLISYKGIEEMLHCARMLIAAGQSINFSLVGDGELLTKLRNLNEPWLHILGPLSNKQVYTELKSADIFVLGTTKKEGSPQALIEAQAAGLPAVAFACEGSEDVIVDNTTGFLVKTWPDFQAKISLLVNDQVLREKFGQAAQKQIQNIFSCALISEQILAVYRHLSSQISRKIKA